MKYNNLKSGFTLIELMVFFVFISMILAASTPIITKRIKNIPQRVYHGKYICFNSGGGLEQRYYNSTREISRDYGACSFKPPRKAAIFKVELIGGGAGGYEYLRDPWDETSDKTASYNIKEGTQSGSAYAFPDGGQLQQILKGASYRIVVKTGSGGNGGDVSRGYTPLSSPYISYFGPIIEAAPEGGEGGEGSGGGTEGSGEQTEPAGLTQEEVNDIISEAYETITDDRYCAAGADSWCYGVPGPSRTSSYNSMLAAAFGEGNFSLSFGTNSVASGRGSRGGAGKYVYIDGTINFLDSSLNRVEIDGTKAYLKQLFDLGVVSGSTSSAGSCAGWLPSAPSSGADGPDIDSSGLTGTIYAEDGADVERYGALKVWNTYCVTNTERATGGKGGWLSASAEQISGSYSWYYEDGQDADGLSGGGWPAEFQMSAGITGTASDSIPSVGIITNLNTRFHETGNGGGSAAGVSTYYVPTLGDDCVFGVASGGPPIDDTISAQEIKNLEAGLYTTLSCNNGSLRFTAEGGKYNTGTTIHDYPGFSYVDGSGSFSSLPSSFNSSVSGGESVYVSSDVFTKFLMAELPGFGAGGSGNKMTDKCTKPYGYYKIQLKYGSEVSRELSYDIERDSCNPVETLVRSGASSGTGGAIIITW